MLATRVIPVLLWGESGCVKGKQFDPGRTIGSMLDRVRLLERRDIDELIVLDIAATPNKRGPRFEEVAQLCENLFMPMTVGGGVRNVADIGRLLRSGADKVSIGAAVRERPELVDEAARQFGSQAVVVSVDVRSGRVAAGIGEAGRCPADWAAEMEDRGAGEILLNSVERDGTMAGYDLELIEQVTSRVSIPVIACGGCGSYEHMQQALNAGAHAVAAGAMFQFREATPKGASRYLHEQGFSVRL